MGRRKTARMQKQKSKACAVSFKLFIEVSCSAYVTGPAAKLEILGKARTACERLRSEAG